LLHGKGVPRLWRFRSTVLTAILLASLLLIVTFPIPWPSSRRQTDPKDKSVLGQVKWGPCEGPHAPGTDCGYIIVPTDYHNLTFGHTKIALGRYRATASPRRGLVLYNPGGPGGGGKIMAAIKGPYLQSIIGSDYDIIGFDPRGVGDTEPRVNCFGAPGNYDLFKRNTVWDKGYDVAPNLTDSRTRDHLLHQYKEARSLSETQFALCAKSMGDELRYMGTTTAARDIDFITTVLEGKDALINFYGVSYGSVMGQYLVNMFPDRIGRVMIDGIVDAAAWSGLPIHLNQGPFLASVSLAYQMFLEGCSKAGPDGCALASNKETAKEIETRISQFFDDLYASPLAVPHAQQPRALTSGAARTFLYAALHAPREWVPAALALSQAMRSNGTLLVDSIPPDFTTDLERLAVICSDQPHIDVPLAEEFIESSLDLLRNVSGFAMSMLTTEPTQGCEYWPVEPRERFVGPWNSTLRNPILIVSNTADPVTPLWVARGVQRRLSHSSRLLLQDGPGHTSEALASVCFVRASLAYFKDGTLPSDGTVCPVDESPFPDLDSSSGNRVGVMGLSGAEKEYMALVREGGYAFQRPGIWGGLGPDRRLQ